MANQIGGFRRRYSRPNFLRRRFNMKSFRLMLSVVLMSLAAAAFAQSDAPKSFDKLKTLAGSWEGPMTTTPKQPDVEGKTMHVSLRVTSTGHVLMHEMTSAGQ